MKLDPNKLKKAESFDFAVYAYETSDVISQNPEIQTPPQWPRFRAKDLWLNGKETRERNSQGGVEVRIEHQFWLSHRLSTHLSHLFII